MTKQTIEVEVRVCVASSSFIDQRLIIEKIQPRRRIVLEETEEFTHPAYAQEAIRIDLDTKVAVESKFVWREVK